MCVWPSGVRASCCDYIAPGDCFCTSTADLSLPSFPSPPLPSPPLQFNRPLTLCKDTIQTRNRKSSGKKKSKGSKKSSSLPTTPSLLPPLSVATVQAAMESPYPGARNFVIGGPGSNFSSPSPSYSPEQHTPYTQAAQFNYNIPYSQAPPPPPTYPISSGYSNYPTMEKDVKPCLPASSAFSVASTAVYTPLGNSSPVGSIEGGSMEPIPNNGFHSSPYSAFSPFPAEQTASPLQPPTSHQHPSPLTPHSHSHTSPLM